MNKETFRHRGARFSRAEISRLISEFERSGLTQVVFCRERELNLGTFRFWMKRYRKEKRIGFREVMVKPDPAIALESMIRFADGMEVQLGGLSVEQLAGLIRRIRQ